MNFKPKKQRLLELLPNALVLTRGPAAGGSRYLSFDDGPHPEHTPRLLDVLAKHGVRASFFMVGRHIELYPRIAERVVAEGHQLGNHSYLHTHFAQMPLRDQVAEFDRTDVLLQQLDRRPRHWMRPPQGHLSWRLLLHFLRHRRGIAYWSYDSLDYRQEPTSKVVGRLRERVPRAGDILLMHDDNACAADALDALLPEWLAAGHTFDVLPDAP